MFKFLFLSCSLLSANLQAVGPIEEDQEHKPTHAANPSDSEINHSLALFELALDTRFIAYLDRPTQRNMALVNHRTYDWVIAHRIVHDPRQLQCSPWDDGPALDSPALYRFNAAVFHAVKNLIILKTRFPNDPIEVNEGLALMQPICDVQAFIAYYVPENMNARQRVLDFLEMSKQYLVNKGPFEISQELTALSENVNNKPEQDLRRVHYFLSTNRYHQENNEFDDKETNPSRMSLLKRHHLTLHYRMHLQGPQGAQLTPQQRASTWDFVVRYGLIVTLPDYQQAAHHLYGAGYYGRAAQVYEYLLTRIGPNADLRYYDCAASAHLWSRNSVRAAELYEEILTRAGPNADLRYYKGAAAAHYFAHNFERANALREEELNRPGATLDDYRRIAKDHFENHASVRAAELREVVLTRAGADASVKDYEDAAHYHWVAGNYVRSAELYEEVLARLGSNADWGDFINAAASHDFAGNYSRAAELLEEVFKLENNWHSYQNAADMHFKASNYDRAAELYDIAYTKSEGKIGDVDLIRVDTVYQIVGNGKADAIFNELGSKMSQEQLIKEYSYALQNFMKDNHALAVQQVNKRLKSLGVENPVIW